MHRRVLLIVLVAMFLGAGLAAPVQAAWYDAELRTWQWDGPVQDLHALKLAPDERHDRYFFAVEADGGMAFAYFSVRHDASGDNVCSGELFDVDGRNRYQQCNDLRVGHDYTVNIHLVGHGYIALYGVNG